MADDWQEYWDDNAQAKYYYNEATGEASWTKPRACRMPLKRPAVYRPALARCLKSGSATWTRLQAKSIGTTASQERRLGPSASRTWPKEEIKEIASIVR